MASSAKKQKAAKVLEALKSQYPVADTQLVYHNAWELLVATELAAQCSDARVNTVTPEFFSRWPGPTELADADPQEVEAVIHPIGFFRNKARNLIGAAKMVCEKFNGELPQTMEELVQLPGVARKTANVVLFAAFGKNEGLAVDTHVKRISYRLGLTDNVEPVKIEKDLTNLLPREEWGDFNHRMVWFGRDVCKARKPDCAKCMMAGFCPKRQPPSGAAKETQNESESTAQK